MHEKDVIDIQKRKKKFKTATMGEGMEDQRWQIEIKKKNHH